MLVPILLFCAAVMYGSPPARLAVVNQPVVNMYSAPTGEADVVSQAIFGDTTEILEEKAGWWKVRTPDRYSGWVQSAGLVENGTAYAVRGKSAQVTSTFASLYREKDITRHQPLLTAPFDAKLQVTAEENGRWLEVELPDHRIAYVQRGDVSLEAAKLTPRESIELGKRFLGLPYLWGGTSTYGIDCSGFTQLLLRHRGFVIPRDADAQAAWEGVHPIGKDELQPGDLLYFGQSAERITHTGYYIGDGDFIHATAHDKPVVQISHLEDPHWTKVFVGARRVK